MAEAQTLHALRQIADALGVPIGALVDPQSARPHDPSIDAARQVTELLRLFDHISDEQKRIECIEFVRKMTF